MACRVAARRSCSDQLPGAPADGFDLAGGQLADPVQEFDLGLAFGLHVARVAVELVPGFGPTAGGAPQVLGEDEVAELLP